MTPPTSERLTYTVEETGQLLGIGRSTAYNAARSGELPTIKVGRRLLVPRAQLERMLGLDLAAETYADLGPLSPETSPD